MREKVGFDYHSSFPFKLTSYHDRSSNCPKTFEANPEASSLLPNSDYWKHAKVIMNQSMFFSTDKLETQGMAFNQCPLPWAIRGLSLANSLSHFYSTQNGNKKKLLTPRLIQTKLFMLWSFVWLHSNNKPPNHGNWNWATPQGESPETAKAHLLCCIYMSMWTVIGPCVDMFATWHFSQ